MKLKVVLGSFLLVFSFIGFAQQNSTSNSAGQDEFDLDALVERVSTSKHLGFLTKLSLKQDINRLLEDIREYHDGTGEDSLEQARERYDAMVHKLIVLLQNKDKALTKSIEDGREQLWEILSDKKKFTGI